MPDIVLTVEEAEAQGFESWQVSATHLERVDGTSPGRAFFQLHFRERRVRGVLVRVTPGRKPHRWFLRRDVVNLGRLGYGGTGDMKLRWGHGEDGLHLQGRQAYVEADRAAGVLFIGDLQTVLKERLGRRFSTDTLRAIPEEILPWHTSQGRTGKYRRYSRDDIEARLQQIRAHLLREPPDGYVFRREAARLVGVTKFEWVDELGNRGALDIHPTYRPRAYSLDSIRAYNKRPLTKAAAEIAGRLRGLGALDADKLFLNEAAAELGIDRDLVTLGINRKFVTVAEWRPLRGRLRGQPLIHRDEIARLKTQRPVCTCGCGELAWPMQRLLQGHHMKFPLNIRVDHGLQLAVEHVVAAGRAPDGEWNSEAIVWARGLCERRQKHAVHHHRERTAEDGSPISESSLRLDAEMVILLAGYPRPPRRDIAIELGITPRHYDKRKRELELAGSRHSTTCRACSKRLNRSTD